MKKFYFVLMDNIKGDAPYDTFCGSFGNETAATEKADFLWQYLTQSEKENRIITVCMGEIKEDTLLENAFDDFDISGGYYVIKEFKL